MANPLLSLLMDVADIKRRLAMMGRHGPVAEVNTSEGWVRLDLGEGDDGPLLSPKIPYAQMAGGLKVHAPPSVGQNMTLFAPTGDTRQAVALPMTWSDENPTPGSGPDPVLTYGEVKATIEPGEIVIEIGGLTLSVSSSAFRVSVGGVEYSVSGAGVASTGGGVGHNGQDIGSTHRHPGIEPGGGITDEPIANGPTP